MEQGWVKVHRSLLDKPIWMDATSEQKVILVTLLMMAAHNARQWQWKGVSYSLQPGQMITSLPSLEQKCGKSVRVQKIRTAEKICEIRFSDRRINKSKSAHYHCELGCLST